MSGKKIIDGLGRAAEHAKHYPETHALAVRKRWCIACRHADEPYDVVSVLCDFCQAPEKRHFSPVVVDVSDA